MNLQSLGGLIKSLDFFLEEKFKTISLSDLFFGSNIFGGGSGIAGRKEIFLTFPFDENYLFCEDFFGGQN